jgi:hypothetical protein
VLRRGINGWQPLLCARATAEQAALGIFCFSQPVQRGSPIEGLARQLENVNKGAVTRWMVELGSLTHGEATPNAFGVRGISRLDYFGRA